MTIISKGKVVARFSMALYLCQHIGYPSWKNEAGENLGFDVGHCYDARCVILVIRQIDSV